MLWTIRKTKNYPLIARLDEKIFGKEEICEDEYDEVTWFLLIVDDKVAGFAGLAEFTEGGIKFGFLERSGILKPFRGHGLQKELIRVREKEARRLKLPSLWTYTAHYNDASSNSLIKSGYKLYTPQEKYGVKNALYWTKKLIKGDKHV